MLHLLLHDGQVVWHLAVAAGGNAVAVAASLPLLQRLDGLGVDQTQEVVLIQGGSLRVVLAGVVRRTVQLDDVGQVAVAVVQVQLGVKSKINQNKPLRTGVGRLRPRGHLWPVELFSPAYRT